jgi:hypothetical protein
LSETIEFKTLFPPGHHKRIAALAAAIAKELNMKEDKVTEWAMWSVKPGTLIKVMSLGVAYLIPEHRSYYLFRTQRSQERRWYQIWVP